MTQKLCGSRSSTQDFLFYQANSAVRNDADSGGSNVRIPCLKKKDLLEISREFSGILKGKAFVRAAMSKLESVSEFSAMMVRIDGFAKPESDPDLEECAVSDERYTVDLVLDVAKLINSVCGPAQTGEAPGMWGLIGHGVFGCFFPEKDEAFCQRIGNAIRKKLAAHRSESVSIGIASYPTISFHRGRILDNARKALEHAAFLGPGSTVAFDAVSLNISGDKLYQKGNIQGAIEEFRTAILLDSANVNVHNSLGVCYGVMGTLEKALGAFKSAIRLDQKEVMALYNVGLVNLFLENRDEALKYFLRAGQIGEDVFEVAFQTGRLYLKMGKSDKGQSFLEKAARLRPESGATFRHLGDCYAAADLTDKAIRAYKKAIRQNPYDAKALSAMGYLFDVLGENPEISTVFCQHSVKIAPENGLFRYRLGRLCLKQNRLDKALDEFVKATELGYEPAMKFIEDIQDRL
ncbi:MAG: hypothetical protein B6245_20855 [Desulfobacteraceae bacterium 4572_88]|nr:MAG: hypothetical protein B6245_20855 [Desulfobacteraceae bacterium 4572_88]